MSRCEAHNTIVPCSRRSEVLVYLHHVASPFASRLFIVALKMSIDLARLRILSVEGSSCYEDLVLLSGDIDVISVEKIAVEKRNPLIGDCDIYGYV